MCDRAGYLKAETSLRTSKAATVNIVQSKICLGLLIMSSVSTLLYSSQEISFGPAWNAANKQSVTFSTWGIHVVKFSAPRPISYRFKTTIRCKRVWNPFTGIKWSMSLDQEEGKCEGGCCSGPRIIILGRSGCLRLPLIPDRTSIKSSSSASSRRLLFRSFGIRLAKL